MRILIVLEPSGGGSGRNALDLVAATLDCGHDTHLIYSATRMDPLFASRLGSICPSRRHRVDMDRAPGPRDLFALRGLRRVLWRLGPFDVIHAHSSKAGALTRLLPRRYGARIYTPHAFRTMDPACRGIAREVFGGVEGALARWATDALICVSPDEMAEAQRLRAPLDRTHLVPNGVPTANPAAPLSRVDMNLSPTDVVFGFVGRLSAQKDPLAFVEAIARIKDPTHIRAIIVGAGELEAQLQQQINAMGLGEVIHCVGQDDAARYYPLFDVFVLTSRYESMPYVLIEAAEAGLPMIATDVSTADSIIADGQNGLIVPRADLATALPKAMAAL
ncbi:MAG: glycosyltransferase, partial [Pseudomonadota bacterium]|nr:glycosyltransferase [Pseudomonadota bacterium]